MESERKTKLERIANFIEKSNESIDKFLNELGWSRDGLRSSQKPNKLSEQNLSTKRSEWMNHRKSRGHIEDPFPESFLAETHPCSVKADSQIKEAPKSHKDLITSFTREERLALYEHAVESTPKQEPPPEFQLSFKKRDNQAKLTSLADIAAYRRDIRRRNQKHRLAKNPLSYQEEMRNLIQLQTEALTEYLGLPKKKDPVKEEACDTTKVVQSKRKRSRTRSRSRERKKSKASKDRDNSRERKRERKKRKRSRSRSRSRHRHKSKKSKRERSKDRSKHKSRH